MYKKGGVYLCLVGFFLIFDFGSALVFSVFTTFLPFPLPLSFFSIFFFLLAGSAFFFVSFFLLLPTNPVSSSSSSSFFFLDFLGLADLFGFVLIFFFGLSFFPGFFGEMTDFCVPFGYFLNVRRK